MSTNYGKFYYFCRDTGSLRSTLPVCNLFLESLARDGQGFNDFGGGCNLKGSILLAFFAIITALGLLWRSNMKKAAVGRREMQLFLIGFIIIEICEIFTVGWFPLDGRVTRVFTAIHIASVVATLWILMMNGAVGYQLLDDGTPLSLALIFGSAAALFIGAGYIALDTGFNWTGYFASATYTPTFPDPNLFTYNTSYSLYTLYQLVPLVFLVVYFILEAVLVLRVLGEVRPMPLSFAIGQIFEYVRQSLDSFKQQTNDLQVISKYICSGTNGAINGALFETLFTWIAVTLIWVFWDSITEDQWPMPTGGSTYT
ncbi:hypothetical protein MRB53_039373 [Persea americana]|nr:hypothetical protein MRB53_039373 [Persea americana]